MKLQPSVKAFDSLRRKISKRYRVLSRIEGGRGYRGVADEFGISPAMAQKIVVEGYEPRTDEVRRNLGLPILSLGRICPIHGVVHDKQCREHKASSSKPRRNWKQTALTFASLLMFKKA